MKSGTYLFFNSDNKLVEKPSLEIPLLKVFNEETAEFKQKLTELSVTKHLSKKCDAVIHSSSRCASEAYLKMLKSPKMNELDSIKAASVEYGLSPSPK